MSGPDSDKAFARSIPDLYQRYLVPLIFEPYAVDLVDRIASRSLDSVLELAAGTGVVTRRLASVLPEGVSIVATDLNPPMLDLASKIGTARHVEWRQADAMQLPFANGMFDAVVCQFGVMFFPDRSKAFAEARRVLRPGGGLIFNAWDRIEENEFADTVTTAVGALFPDDPPRSWSAHPMATATARRSNGTSQAADSRGHRGSTRSHIAAAPGLPVTRRSRSARGRRCGTRSKRAAPRGSAKRRTVPRRSSRSASGEEPWTARSKRTSSRSRASVKPPVGQDVLPVQIARFEQEDLLLWVARPSSEIAVKAAPREEQAVHRRSRPKLLARRVPDAVQFGEEVLTGRLAGPLALTERGQASGRERDDVDFVRAVTRREPPRANSIEAEIGR